jgi:hypothetical protein
MFKREFEELNNTINFLKNKYRRRKKKEKGFKYPRLDIDELQEFNNLQHENCMNGVPKPAIAASLTAAASSNCRLQTGKKEFTTSVSPSKASLCPGLPCFEI